MTAWPVILQLLKLSPRSISELILLANSLVLIAAYSRNPSEFKQQGDFECLCCGRFYKFINSNNYGYGHKF